MSWFGLFHTIFGIGAVAKDAISDSMHDTVAREKAYEEGRETYLVNGYKLRSTKTGKDAYIDHGASKEDHTYIRDVKTGNIIEDVTLKQNAKNQIVEKEKSKTTGVVFYRTTKYDTSNIYKSPVYICDNISGYFSRDYNFNIGEYVYEEGRLVKAPKSYKCVYVVETPIWEEGNKTYFEDGSIYKICVIKKNKKQNGEECISKGWNYYKKGEVF